MNYSKTILLLNKNVRCVLCKYEEGHTNKIFKTLDATIAKDDIVVVTTETRVKRTCVQVIEVDVDVDLENGEQLNWVIQKVDEPAFKILKDQEDAMIAKVRKAEQQHQRKELGEKLLKAHSSDLEGLPLIDMGSTQALPAK